MTDEGMELDLEAIRKRCEAATPGPWLWDVNPVSRSVSLSGRLRFAVTVMDFERWGMMGAAPRFRHMDGGPDDGLMSRVEHFAEIEPGREHHATWHRALVHPDAEFIAAARTDVPALLARIEKLEWDLEAAETETERLRAQPSHQQQPGWLPIESAPKDGTHVLLTDGEMISCGYWCGSQHAPRWMSDSGEPTHWQPLPEPPANA